MKEKANLDHVDQIAGGDEEFRDKFLAILKDEFPVERDEYISSIQQKDYANAFQIVHKVKHKLNLLSLFKSHKVAVNHEKELRNNQNELHTEFMAILDYVDMYLKSI